MTELEEEWDILKLDDDIEWSHIQILNRLHNNDIDCILADIWTDDNIAYLVGVTAHKNDIANALGMHRESVYCLYDQCFVILNLFQEKYLRGLIK